MPRTFTRRDRANAMTAHAFRNGHIENLHAGRGSALGTNSALAKFTRSDLQTILLESSGRMADLLRMRDERPEELRRLVAFHRDNYTRDWIRSRASHSPAPIERFMAADGPPAPSIEEEARAVACFSFIDGFLSQWHRGQYSPLLDDPGISRIRDQDMASLMIDASERLAGCMALRWRNIQAYHAWIHGYQDHVSAWLADGPIVADPEPPRSMPRGRSG